MATFAPRWQSWAPRLNRLIHLVAVHVLELDFVLGTRNLREFSRIEGLRLENWID
jgi:predicted nucleic acid-binding protein